MKVAVTGGSGRIGGFVIKELLAHGHEIVNLDVTPPSEPSGRFVRTDLEDLGQTYGGLSGMDAVIHLAAIPHPLSDPPEVVFRNNVMSTYNVLEAASALGISRVVLTSSDSAVGFPFARHAMAPEYVPMDEDHPLWPQDPYGLSKQVGEVIADSFVRRTPAMTVITLRPSFVVFPEMYARFPQEWQDPARGSFNLWAYTDVRDLATAFRLALTAPLTGHHRFFIAAPNSRIKDVPTADLVRRYFPDTKRIELTGTQSALDCRRAERLLGWRAQHTWEMYV